LSTITLTSGNDTVKFGFGLTGSVNGTPTTLTGNTFDGAGGVNAITDPYSMVNPYFTVSLADTGVVTFTNASGAVGFVNFQKLQFTDVSLDLGTANADTITSTSATGDKLYGFAGNDILTGGAGADTLYGGSGNDHLIATSGHTFMNGGTGNDTLTSGTGVDQMTGGTGHDLFVISAHSTKDTITDFTLTGVNSDVINLHGSGVAAHTFAQLLTHMTQSGKNAVIDLGSHHTVTLDNVSLHSLVAHDFVL